MTATLATPQATRQDGRLAGALETLLRRARSARHRTARALRLTADVVTALGWAVLLTVLVAFWAGYGFGWIELVAIAWAGLVLIVAAAGYLFGRSGFGVSLSMTADRLVVGDRVPGVVSVHNPTRWALPGVNVEVPVGAGIAEFVMPGLARAASFEDVFIVPTRRRGIIPVGPVRTVRSDPIGLVRRERVWMERINLFVHPRTISIPSMSTGFVRDLEGNPTRDLSSSDVSFHALREYVAGDERRSIHWKSTAKTGTYMVRQYEESRRSHLIVALSLAESDYASDEEFEMAVSVAGSLGVRAIRDARTVAVVVSAPPQPRSRRRNHSMRELRTLTQTRLLDDLSGVDSSPAALGITELAGIAAESVAGVSVAFLVCGSATGLARLRAASTRFPAGVEVVAVVCDPEAVPSLRRVNELSVLRIGFLEDLQKSLARRAAA